ncbi:MAG: L,D-transpeptidase [Pseudomonadota bacterium]
MKLRILVSACLLAGLFLVPALPAAPALALEGRDGNIPNHQMPFPRLMNSLFGGNAETVRPPQRSRAVINRAPQPQMQRAWQPQRNQPAVRQDRNVRQASAPAANAARQQIAPHLLPQVVSYQTSQAPGTIVIDTNTRYLYLVMANGQARRYGVGVGRPGFEWAGTHRVTRKAEWPSWTPPETMKARARAQGQILPDFMPGGPDNPMGARALYLGSTLYRIHGSNEPWTIGQAVSSGCIRMRNQDVIDLYERVPVGAKVVVI